MRRRRSEFQDLLYQNLRRVGSASSENGEVVPTGVQIGLGVKLAGVYRIHAQGNLSATENPFDLAIQGRGFFPIEMPNGEIAYTRDGTFQLNAQGQMVTHDGYIVQPAVAVPEDAVDVTINQSGEVLAKLQGQVDLQNVGQLQLAIFPNDAGLEAIGGNLFRETGSGAPVIGQPMAPGFGSVLQGFLEISNVNAVEEITNLISAQRAYEMNSKVIQAADEMLATISNVR
jgi:flagellar basal-body rod protein FlgG